MQPHSTDVEHKTPTEQMLEAQVTPWIGLCGPSTKDAVQTGNLPCAPFPGGADPDKEKSLNSMGKVPGNLGH